MNKQNLTLDTSVLIQNGDWLEKNIENFNYIVPSTVVDELDNQKESTSPKRAFIGRNGLRTLEKLENHISYIISDKCSNLPEDFDYNNNDNKIISCAKNNNSYIATRDRGLKLKAQSIGIKCVEVNDSENRITKGYKVLELDTRRDDDSDTLASIYEGTFDLFDMFENEYLIIKDLSYPDYNITDSDEEFLGYKTIDIVRYSKGKFVQIKLPPKKIITPMNDLQKCALDLLNNDSVPVKIIAGGFGSGKTMLSTVMSIYKTVEKGEYASIMALRNPLVEGEQIGFLPGTKADKTDGFFAPFIQHLKGGEFEADDLERRGVLKKEILGYIKGLSIGQTFIIVDEAEDLTLKQLKMCGSRIEADSAICFIGDYKQTHDKLLYSSGLLELIEKTKHSEFSGVIVLEEDLRSSASKLFADI